MVWMALLLVVGQPAEACKFGIQRYSPVGFPPGAVLPERPAIRFHLPDEATAPDSPSSARMVIRSADEEEVADTGLPRTPLDDGADDTQIVAFETLTAGSWEVLGPQVDDQGVWATEDGIVPFEIVAGEPATTAELPSIVSVTGSTFTTPTGFSAMCWVLSSAVIKRATVTLDVPARPDAFDGWLVEVRHVIDDGPDRVNWVAMEEEATVQTVDLDLGRAAKNPKACLELTVRDPRHVAVATVPATCEPLACGGCSQPSGAGLAVWVGLEALALARRRPFGEPTPRLHRSGSMAGKCDPGSRGAPVASPAS